MPLGKQRLDLTPRLRWRTLFLSLGKMGSPQDLPEPRFAKSGDVYIAYRVEGEGPFDLVFVPPGLWSIDRSEAYQSGFRDVVRQLSSFARLIQFDKRGTGSSDGVVGAPTLEERMDDMRAVMDAVGSRCAALVGVADGAAMGVLFAATFPARTFALALMRLKPRYVWAEDYPWAPTREQYERETMDVLNARVEGRMVERGRRVLARLGDRGEVTDHELWERAREVRQSMPPSAFLALRRMTMEIDVRHILSSVAVPTLLMYRPHAADADETGDIPLMSYMHERMPHAEIVEASGDIRQWYAGLTEPLRDFLPRAWTDYQQLQAQPRRVLATVLFTDIVGSTARAVELGPRWQELLREHNAVVRRQIHKFSGREIDTAGDGFFASGFDGPARAVRCGCAIRDEVTGLGLGIRVGVHTGECDVVDDKLSGLAVNIGARVAAQAEEGEVFVSGTVKDLVAGSGIAFEPRGTKELKGLGEWPLYAVARPDEDPLT
jgi:class 3 adenylate cyclase/pimeloyl-ACP methyl ester carboxylesterase